MCQAHQIPSNSESAFSDRLVDTINAGATALMISVGHRTRLFDAMDGRRPMVPEELASHAGLDARYVREWLGAMACAGIVEVDRAGERYSLPADHAAHLCRRGGADNLAPFTQYISVLGGVETRIVECFRQGGGVDYSEFERFHEVMAEDSGQSVLSSLFDVILPLVSGIDERLERGIEVLDLGCGQGRALIAMAKRYPASRFFGYDLCQAPLETARQLAQEAGVDNVTFAQRDAETITEQEQFDFVTTFDAIHDQARPDRVLENIHRSLKPGGRYLMQDIDASSNVAQNLDHPLGPLLYTVSTMHCMTVSLARNGMGLGTMWGRDRARLLLKEAGFETIEEHMLDHDPQNRYFVLSK